MFIFLIADLCLLIFIFGLLACLKIPVFTNFISKPATSQLVLHSLNQTVSSSDEIASNSVANAAVSKVIAETELSKCNFNKDITVYMDGFDAINRIYYKGNYQRLLNRSKHCDRLPGGGRCLFNTKQKSSDAIFYYGAYTKLKFKRVFNDQIVVVFTQENEEGRYCHFPPPDQYDIKLSYRRDSTIPVPFLCGNNLALRVAEMGQPDVPVGREKLVVGFVSHCGYKWRQKYLTELMKYIHIDQWGKCLKNTPGEFWKTRWTSFEDEKLSFLKESPYKFLISFENNIADDYITEKIYHAYLTRTIPIFYGDRKVFDIVPANTSLIYANDYTPKELAKLITRVANDDTLYSEYFKNWDLAKMRKLHEQYCTVHLSCATCNMVWSMLHDRKCGN